MLVPFLILLLPGSYQSAVMSYLAYKSSDNMFVDTIRSVIRAGGCNCSRANYAAALVAAEKGVSCLPLHWICRVNNIDQILSSIMAAAAI